ncbi:MAG: nucleotide exchange factor GrpE [Ignavibacteria bacterium]|nr:nucleotide exchange factor GrpE [Ignavibacteria bacterium]
MKSRKEKTNNLNETEIKINGSSENTEEITDKNENISKSAEGAKIKELEAEILKYKDLYLRTAAEFENYKRRTDSERVEFYAYAGEKVLTDMLGVLDDFDRILESFEKDHDKDALKKGIDIVNEKFRKVLSKHGLKVMDTDGKKFDVNLHEAIMQQPDENKEPETILATSEKGYFLKDKVLRHAKVVVSSKPDLLI